VAVSRLGSQAARSRRGAETLPLAPATQQGQPRTSICLAGPGPCCWGVGWLCLSLDLLGQSEQLRGGQFQPGGQAPEACVAGVALARLDVADPSLVQVGVVGELLLGQPELFAAGFDGEGESGLEGRQGRCRVGGRPLPRHPHFAGWYMVNELEMSSEDVAIALGHQDGGNLVRRLYGRATRVARSTGSLAHTPHAQRTASNARDPQPERLHRRVCSDGRE
jgi:hypothetical protein